MHKFNKWALILIFVNLTDLATTFYILNTGGVEYNPLARFILVNAGFLGLILFKAVFVSFIITLANKFYKKDRSLDYLRIPSGIFALVTLWNVKVMFL